MSFVYNWHTRRQFVGRPSWNCWVVLSYRRSDGKQICACEEKPFSTNVRQRLFFSCSLSQTLVEGVIRIKTRKKKYWPLLEYLRMCTAHYTNMDEDDDVLEKRSRLPAPWWPLCIKRACWPGWVPFQIQKKRTRTRNGWIAQELKMSWRRTFSYVSVSVDETVNQYVPWSKIRKSRSIGNMFTHKNCARWLYQGR